MKDKIQKEIASFARLNCVSPASVTSYQDAVEARIGHDSSNKSPIAKRAAAVRFVVEHCPLLYLRFRQGLVSAAMKSEKERIRECKATADAAKAYRMALNMPLAEGV